MKKILMGIVIVCLLLSGCDAVDSAVPTRPPDKELYPKGTQLIVEQRIIQAISDFADLFEIEKILYVWGGSDPNVLTYDTQKKAWRKGADCSGSIQNIFLKAGIKLPRTTALKMWLIWPGKQVTSDAEVWKQSKLPNLVFFTWPAKGKAAKRPFGHVGLIRNNKGKTIEMSEASSSKGYFKRTPIIKGDYRDTHKEGILQVDIMKSFVGKK
jgi:hypothetical protein